MTNHTLSKLLCPDRAVGPYRLVRSLGKGGFAPVWLAQERFGGVSLREVAIKIFSVAGLDAIRVAEEARALCRVEHPNIVRFYSLVEDPASGVIALAMEHVGGTSLEQRLQEGRLGPSEAVKLGIALASALTAVHKAGLVHRDIKPANVIDTGASFKLIDFGIALDHASGARGSRVVLVDDIPLQVDDTFTDALGGTLVPSSSDPEMRAGTVGFVDPACFSGAAAPTFSSDLYGLGATLFASLMGVAPAYSCSGGGLSMEVLSGRSCPPKLKVLRPDLPGDLTQIVDALLSADQAARPRSAEWVAIELERVHAGLEGRKLALAPESIGPFRGLSRFEADDRDVYFGRTREVATAVELLRASGMLTLIGSSGSGKSSLARAGLLPRLAEGALGAWPPAWDVVTFTPGIDPDRALRDALAKLLEPPAIDGDIEGLFASLSNRLSSLDRGVVVFIDQLEEIVTLGGSAETSLLSGLLTRLGERATPGLRAVTALRQDLLDPLLSVFGIGRWLVRNSLLVEPIADAGWGEIIANALERYGYALEDDEMLRELTHELRGAGLAMPLVQFALTELWQARDDKARRLTRRALSAMGGLEGSLERHAEATATNILAHDANAESALRSVLIALTTPRGTRAFQHEQALVSIAGVRTLSILRALEAARLVVKTETGWTLAHEALTTHWQRLRNWLQEARGDRALLEELEQDAKRWHQNPRSAPLWSRVRLREARAVSGRPDLDLSELATSFLRASLRHQLQLRLGFGVLGLLAIALGVGLVAVWTSALRTRQLEAVKLADNERHRREEAELAQAELGRRQDRIDQLLLQLDDTKDPVRIAALREEIEEVRDGADVTAKPPGSTIPLVRQRGPQAVSATSSAQEPPPVTSSARGPKVQKW